MENGVVDFLRDRTEEKLDDVLKTSMGGYTKKSVQDYVNRLHKLQQSAGKRFDEELKHVLAEKESINEELKRTKTKLSQSEAQYQVLSESLKEYKRIDAEDNVGQVVELKKQVAKQGDTISTLKTDNQLLEQRNEQLQQQIDELTKEVEQLDQEQRLSREYIQDEKKKNVNALEQIQELTTQLTLAQNDLTFVKEQMSESVVTKLREQVEELQSSLKSQQLLLEQRGEELKIKDSQMQESAQQYELQQKQQSSLVEKTRKLQKIIEVMTIQNQQMDAYQQELTAKLQEVFADSLKLIQAKSELQLENQRLSTRLRMIRNGLTAKTEEQKKEES